MLAVLLLGVFSPAYAEDDFSLAAVKQAIEKQSSSQALDAWYTEREKLSCPKRIPNTSNLAQFWVYKGYIHYHNGVQNAEQEEYDLAQAAWKKAFTIDLKIQFDESVLSALKEEEKENVLNFFEQNRRLIDDRKQLDAQVPEKIGEATLFIDGVNVVQNSTVLPGAHLLQIDCPQDSLQSKWMYLEGEDDQLDWFSLCPSGVDTSIEVESDDMFAEMGFGSSVDTSEMYNPSPICHEDPTLSQRNKGFALSFSPDVFTRERLVIAGGGMSLAAGLASYYAWMVPTYQAIEDARADLEQVSDEEAAALSREFNVARWTTIGLLTTGIGLSAYGTKLQFQSTGSGFQIGGQF